MEDDGGGGCAALLTEDDSCRALDGCSDITVDVWPCCEPLCCDGGFCCFCFNARSTFDMSENRVDGRVRGGG